LLAEGVSGRFVPVSSDFNVPFEDGRITASGRIVASVPRLEALADAGRLAWWRQTGLEPHGKAAKPLLTCESPPLARSA
jgi:hypothetical protein